MDFNLTDIEWIKPVYIDICPPNSEPVRCFAGHVFSNYDERLFYIPAKSLQNLCARADESGRIALCADFSDDARQEILALCQSESTFPLKLSEDQNYCPWAIVGEL